MNASVAILMPSYRMMDPRVVQSMIGLLRNAWDVLCSFDMLPGLYIDEARNRLVKGKPASTHTLWLDDDMVWPPDMIERLLAHGRPVVGAQYFRRLPPYDTAAGDFAGRGSLEVRPLRSLPTGLRPTDVLGMGATLIETRVFRLMAERFGDELWFRSEQSGEDVWFFDRLRQMGVQPYLDCDLECEHLQPRGVTSADWRAHHPAEAGNGRRPVGVH